ncbi:hypothetical protein DFJ74DRAFT_690184 [Hyaloraphidium curvatum]|nr:hypothetical protein DFJ74DRAFT_697902 [Hyaloraphidium curvatum]KAI9007003.1 hypothetical protein DFJ74DRAFT_690184 [Hyaloraphidium curvatum]
MDVDEDAMDLDDDASSEGSAPGGPTLRSSGSPLFKMAKGEAEALLAAVRAESIAARNHLLALIPRLVVASGLTGMIESDIFLGFTRGFHTWEQAYQAKQDGALTRKGMAELQNALKGKEKITNRMGVADVIYRYLKAVGLWSPEMNAGTGTFADGASAGRKRACDEKERFATAFGRSRRIGRFCEDKGSVFHLAFAALVARDGADKLDDPDMWKGLWAHAALEPQLVEAARLRLADLVRLYLDESAIRQRLLEPPRPKPRDPIAGPTATPAAGPALAHAPAAPAPASAATIPSTASPSPSLPAPVPPPAGAPTPAPASALTWRATIDNAIARLRGVYPLPAMQDAALRERSWVSAAAGTLAHFRGQDDHLPLLINRRPCWRASSTWWRESSEVELGVSVVSVSDVELGVADSDVVDGVEDSEVVLEVAVSVVCVSVVSETVTEVDEMRDSEVVAVAEADSLVVAVRLCDSEVVAVKLCDSLVAAVKLWLSMVVAVKLCVSLVVAVKLWLDAATDVTPPRATVVVPPAAAVVSPARCASSNVDGTGLRPWITNVPSVPFGPAIAILVPSPGSRKLMTKRPSGPVE